MIYRVEMDFANTARQADWDAWYLRHIGVLLTVPGFNASQRFKAVVDTTSAYLALHEVASAAVFDSPAYRAKGGPGATGEWQAQMTNWRRNLLDGLAETPEVAADRHLLVLDDAGDVALPPGVAVTWLTAIGLDRSIERCGLAVVADPAPLRALALSDKRVRLFRPVTAKLHSA